jgi:ATP-dependent helicase HrpB
LCIDVDDAREGPETTVRLASQIDPAWLPESSLREADEPFFHPSRKAVVMRRRRYFEDLLLEESPVSCLPSDQTAAILYEHALRCWEQVFPADQKDLTGFIERVRFLNANAPELGLPAIDEERLREVLAELCQRRTSFAELREAPWSAHLQGKFDYETLQRLEAEAPTRIRVPSGNTVAVRYESGQPPRVEVRLQELFGWTETPRIAGGRVPIQLHLLGPNFRPQQITDDLASFWRNTYQEVRKELRRRYPKHHWPEDPLTATATRNSLKPKKL